MNAYVFILCPPFSGSTVLWKLISTSSAVSALPSEGQFLPELKEVMRQAPWDADVVLPWARIKQVWTDYWDQQKPLLIEKSPPNIIRTKEILQHFNPVHFIIMVRNPYAHCEGIIRRNGFSPQIAAEFTVRCLQQQMENAEKLSSALCFTYEEMVKNPEAIAKRIQSFLPQIGELKHAQSFKVHSIDGLVERGVVDLNQRKINNLSPNEIRQINTVLKANAAVLDYWGYKFLEPSAHHAFKFYRARVIAQLTATASKFRRAAFDAIKKLAGRLA